MNKQEIIIVDDNDLLSFIHCDIVSKAGFEEKIKAFPHGKLAFDYIMERKGTEIPLLILLDITMPIMDAWAVLDILPTIERNENIFVAIVTSSVSDDDRKKAFTYPHVIEFIEKPMRIDAVRKVVALMHDKIVATV
jgi:response regulator RpfG family c-di-GMP phosphodiesterase